MPPASLAASIPVYRIDLGLPPRQRYTALCADFANRMRALEYVLDDILLWAIGSLPLFRSHDSLIGRAGPWMVSLVKSFMRVFLGRFSSAEQREELEGIRRETGVRIVALFALNMFLDCLMGCTSGGVLVRDRAVGTQGGKKDSEGLRKVSASREPSRTDENAQSQYLMHFRTLDWGMDELRELLVKLEYVNSLSPDPEEAIATSVTYAGYVGVLTGVRKNLSISLNVRAVHACSNLSLMAHQALVLFGIRSSVGCLLRTALLDTSSLFKSDTHQSTKLDCAAQTSADFSSLEDLATSLSEQACAPCYLTLTDGRKVIIIEKDLWSGAMASSDSFAAITNHDVATACNGSRQAQSANSSLLAEGLGEWIAESGERRDALYAKWEQHLKRSRQKGNAAETQRLFGIDVGTLKEWLEQNPTMNECTHFACIMDAVKGTVKWLKRG